MHTYVLFAHYIFYRKLLSYLNLYLYILKFLNISHFWESSQHLSSALPVVRILLAVLITKGKLQQQENILFEVLTYGSA